MASSPIPVETYTKVVFLGSNQVGKSSIIKRMLDLKLDSELYIPTIGIRFYNLDLKVDKQYYLQLWDVSGKELHSESIFSFLKGAVVVILVFDYKNNESQLELLQIYDNIIRYVPPVNVILVGNKFENEKNKIPKRMQSWVTKNNLILLPLSARENVGHSLLLQNIIKLIDKKTGEETNQIKDASK